MWLIVIGAIVLMVLMAIAVSQIRSNLPKGRAAAAIERTEMEVPVAGVHVWPLRAVDVRFPPSGRGESSIESAHPPPRAMVI
jgi:hypothetical protein